MDSTTLFIVSALIVVLCGVSFILNTALNRNDAAGKLWSLSFIAGIAVAFGYGVALIGAGNWWGLVVGNVGLVVLSGAFWSGSRLYNSRDSLLWTVGAASAGEPPNRAGRELAARLETDVVEFPHGHGGFGDAGAFAAKLREVLTLGR